MSLLTNLSIYQLTAIADMPTETLELILKYDILESLSSEQITAISKMPYDNLEYILCYGKVTQDRNTKSDELKESNDLKTVNEMIMKTLPIIWNYSINEKTQFIDKITNLLEKHSDQTFYLVYIPESSKHKDISDFLTNNTPMLSGCGSIEVYSKDNLQKLLPGIKLEKICYTDTEKPRCFVSYEQNSNSVFVIRQILSKCKNVVTVHPELLHFAQLSIWFKL